MVPGAGFLGAGTGSGAWKGAGAGVGAGERDAGGLEAKTEAELSDSLISSSFLTVFAGFFTSSFLGSSFLGASTGFLSGEVLSIFLASSTSALALAGGSSMASSSAKYWLT